MRQFNREYIIQVIEVSANNLRLNTDKIETVSILKDFIKKNSDLELAICDLKKITELSKLGIKLFEILNYLKNNRIDLLSISETFKSHSHIIIPILNQSLDNISSETMKSVLARYNQEEDSVELQKEELKIVSEDGQLLAKQDTDKIKEEIIFEDIAKDSELDFEEFQQRAMKPIKSIENLLERMLLDNYSEDELLSYSEIMDEHRKLAEAMSFTLLAKMHKAISKAFFLLGEKKIKPNDYLIESLRACLIVIVATIKNKDVDITNYLNIAEIFFEKINKM